MLKLFQSSRCQSCYTERAIRICPRKRKNICWQCCNEIRCDTHCPENCVYAPQKDETNPFPAFKADSRAEAENAIKHHIDLWIGKENPFLQNKTPEKAAAENPQEMLAWLSGYQYPVYFPMDYLLHKLNLPFAPAEKKEDPEDCVEKWMKTLIQLKWDELRQYSINQSSRKDLAERYKELIQAIPRLDKVSTYSMLYSGLGEDGISALVYIELNHKIEWTLVLSNISGSWKIRQNIAGSPQAYFQQNKIYTAIAEALGKADDTKVWELINNGLKIYPDSPDLFYYRALYWQLVKQREQSAVDFFNAIALDNNWTEPYLHLNAYYFVKEDYEQAKIWLEELKVLQPDDPKVLNNLAAAYAGNGETEKAKELWQEIEKKYPAFEYARKNLEKLQ